MNRRSVWIAAASGAAPSSAAANETLCAPASGGLQWAPPESFPQCLGAIHVERLEFIRVGSACRGAGSANSSRGAGVSAVWIAARR